MSREQYGEYGYWFRGVNSFFYQWFNEEKGKFFYQLSFSLLKLGSNEKHFSSISDITTSEQHALYDCYLAFGGILLDHIFGLFHQCLYLIIINNDFHVALKERDMFLYVISSSDIKCGKRLDIEVFLLFKKKTPLILRHLYRRHLFSFVFPFFSFWTKDFFSNLNSLWLTFNN